MRILGIDPSLTHTGICLLNPQDDRLEYDHDVRTCAPKTKGAERLHDIYTTLNQTYIAYKVELAVMEGYAFSPRFGQAFSLGEAGGVIKLYLYQQLVPLYIVAPQSLKKFVTGAGKGQKNQMLLSAYKKYGISFENDHECDAYCLAQIGKIIWQVKNQGLDMKTLHKYEREVVETVCKGKK